MQVTEGDGYYLGRVLINAQIAAGYALTLRLRHHWYFVTGTSAYGCSKKIRHIIQTRGHSCADPRPSRFGSGLTLSDRILHADAHPPG